MTRWVGGAPLGRPRKDETERQDDEAQRLVRKSPKKLPPRKDRKREVVKDDDPDLREDDEGDLSMRSRNAYVEDEMDARKVKSYISRLDRIAGVIQARPQKLGLTRLEGQRLAAQVDAVADEIEAGTFGRRALEARKAKVVEGDPDEPYMGQFNDEGLLEGEPDEPYMSDFEEHRFEVVHDRPEVAVQDLNDWAGGTKRQPSWKDGVYDEPADLL